MSRLGRGRGPIGDSRVQSKYFPLEGGLNLTDPALSLKAGECLAAVNHEPAVPRGYSRVEGYERFDGRPSPSAATYWTLEFTAGSIEIPINSAITSHTLGPIPSLITAKTISLPIVISGSFAGGDAEGYIILKDMVYGGADTEFTITDILTYSTTIDWAIVKSIELEAGAVPDIITGTTVALDGLYSALQFKAGTDKPAVGDTVKGASSGTEGVMVSLPVVDSGTWAGGDAAGFVVLVNFGGKRFTPDEAITISAPVTTPFATAQDKGELYANTASANFAHFLHLAQEERRAVITAVPGEGPVRGVWMFEGEVFAFRNAVGSASAAMFKSTSSGWVQQTLGTQYDFTDAIVEIVEGDTITGDTSGAVGVVRRLVRNSGNWLPEDKSSGSMSLSGLVGTFIAGENFSIAAATVAVLATVTANALSPGGHYDFDNYNFYGNSEKRAMYFVNGVNRFSEWDGTGLTMIPTGMENDKPVLLRNYAYHAFLAFPGGSLQNSSLGNPLEWSALTGAAEMGVGDEITGLAIEANKTLTVLSRNSAHVLYGSSVADFELKPFHQSMGALPWTTQKIGQTWYLDDRGLTTLTLAQDYGDFAQNSVSIKVDPFLKSRMDSVRCSQIVRSKNQYRIFFGDGFALFGAFNGKKVLGFLPVKYPDQPFCSVSVEDLNGREKLFMGCDNGFVYQQDIGTSFDGAEIEAGLLLNYYHYETPTYNKRFRGVNFELDMQDNADIQFTPDFSYGSDEIPRAVTQRNGVIGGGGLWGYALWDSFLWSGQVISTGRNRVDGVGSNMGMMIFSSSKYLQSYTLQGITVAYSIRKLIR